MAKRLSRRLFAQHTSAKARKPVRTHPMVERLETRLVPAGNVTVVVDMRNGVPNGGLHITGDATDNNITITQQTTAGQYVIHGVGTTLNGASSDVTVNGITSMAIDMGAAGDFQGDTVNFLGPNTGSSNSLNGPQTITSTGALHVGFDALNTGVGNDLNITGLMTINHENIFGLTVAVGNGTVASDKTALAGGLIVRAGAGASTVSVTGSASVGYLSDNNAGTGSGPTDQLVIDNATINRFVSFTGSTGNDTVLIGDSGSVTIGQNANINLGGGGNDSLFVGTGAAVAITGYLHVTGSGSESIKIGTGAAVTIGTSLQTTGSGAESITIGSLGNPVTVGSFISINAPASTSADSITITNTTDNGFLSIKDGDATAGGANLIVLNTDTIATQTAIFTGAGADSVFITNSNFHGTTFGAPLKGAFDLETGAGADSIILGSGSGGTVIFGAAYINAGLGADTLQLGTVNLEKVTFGDTATLDGGDTAKKNVLTTPSVTFSTPPTILNFP